MMLALFFVLALTAEPAAIGPCDDSAEYRQLDFWIGQWDVHDPSTGEKQGENRIERILDGCLLLEHWSGAGGSNGKSMSFFDPGTRTWRQLWVSEAGNVLDYTRGEIREGAMHFSGLSIDAGGDTTLQRLVFEPVSPDTVRQIFSMSEDGGKTWRRTWVGVYVRKPDTR